MAQAVSVAALAGILCALCGCGRRTACGYTVLCGLLHSLPALLYGNVQTPSMYVFATDLCLPVCVLGRKAFYSLMVGTAALR